MIRHTTKIAVALVFLSPLVCVACSVPVFRYALENWEPDALTVAVLHDGPLSAEQSQWMDTLKAASQAENSANLQLHPIDVAADHSEGSPEAYYAEQWKDKELPRLLVFFNNNAPEPQLAWSTVLTENSISQLIDSPARREVVERLLDGQTAVWILLQTGDAKTDARAEKELLEELAKKPDEITLPSLTDLESEEKFNEELPVEMRVEFSVITIAPDDPKETFFREMLLNTESDLKDFNEPIAIPIYGRGRTYFALVGQGITADNIADNCNFLCGACSCEVKRDNPGQDLLLAANWNRVQPGNWVNDTPLPELTGIGGFEPLLDGEPGDQAEGTSNAANKELTDVSDANATHLTAITDPTDSATPSGQSSNEHGSQEGVSSNSSAETVTYVAQGYDGAPMILLWGAILFGVGLVFTVWQRSRNSE